MSLDFSVILGSTFYNCSGLTVPSFNQSLFQSAGFLKKNKKKNPIHPGMFGDFCVTRPQEKLEPWRQLLDSGVLSDRACPLH